MAVAAEAEIRRVRKTVQERDGGYVLDSKGLCMGSVRVSFGIGYRALLLSLSFALGYTD